MVPMDLRHRLTVGGDGPGQEIPLVRMGHRQDAPTILKSPRETTMNRKLIVPSSGLALVSVMTVAPATPTAGAPGCPNPNWTEHR